MLQVRQRIGLVACAAILFGLFNIGFPRARWSQIAGELRAHGAAAFHGPLDYLRSYFSRYEDEQLYFAYGSLATGQAAPASALDEWRLRRPDLATKMPASHALVPYRDFEVEYPPLAVEAFALAALPSRGDFQRFKWLWSLLMESAIFGAVLLALRTRRRLGEERDRSAPIGYAALVLFLIGPIVLDRMDALAVLAVAAAFAAVSSRRRRLAAALLGLGFAVKLFPALALPALLAPSLARRQYRALLGEASAFLIAGLLPFLPFLLVAPHGLAELFAYHARRGLHLESVLATPLLLARLAGAKASVSFSFGSWNLDGPGCAPLLALASLGTLVAPLAVGVVLYRRQRAAGPRPLPVTDEIAAMGGALAAALVFGKVLSFQYLLWLFPSVLLIGSGEGARGRRRAVTARLLFALAAAIGQIVFPYLYGRLVALDGLAILLLTARNLTVVALAVFCVWPIGARPAESSLAELLPGSLAG